MFNFWDSNVWSWILLMAVLLGSLLVGNTLRRKIPFLRNSLIPTSVIGGAVLLIFTSSYKMITGEVFFDTAIFGGDGLAPLLAQIGKQGGKEGLFALRGGQKAIEPAKHGQAEGQAASDARGEEGPLLPQIGCGLVHDGSVLPSGTAGADSSSGRPA